VHDGYDLDHVTRANSINQGVRENLEAAAPHSIVEYAIASGRYRHSLFRFLPMTEKAELETLRLSLIPFGGL